LEEAQAVVSALASVHPAVLIVLLDALGDQQPCPKSPRWERDAERGLTASSWRTCPSCQGDGTQKRRNHRVTCPSCRGHGGWLTDAYAVHGEHVAPDSGGVSEMSLLQFYETAQAVADHSGSPGIERIERIFERRLDDDTRHQTRKLHPCFAQLEHALRDLSAVAPHHVQVLHAVHVTHLPLNGDLALYDDALLLLGDVLGASFRAPRWALEQAETQLRAEREAKARAAHNHVTPAERAHRDQEIRRLAFQGRSQKQIAARVGVDQATVSRVLKRQ
jgi:hypothetical protein